MPLLLLLLLLRRRRRRQRLRHATKAHSPTCTRSLSPGSASATTKSPLPVLLPVLLLQRQRASCLYNITLTHLHAITQPRQCLCHHPVSPASEGGEHAGPVNLRQRRRGVTRCVQAAMPQRAPPGKGRCKQLSSDCHSDPAADYAVLLTLGKRHSKKAVLQLHIFSVWQAIQPHDGAVLLCSCYYSVGVKVSLASCWNRRPAKVGNMLGPSTCSSSIEGQGHSARLDSRA
jgi:hypothetical protein